MAQPLSLASVRADSIRNELDRRKRLLTPLLRRHAQALKVLRKLEAQIRDCGGGPEEDRTPTGRRRNTRPLAPALAEVFKGRTLGVAQATQEVLSAGYHTNAKDFQLLVNGTLHSRKDLFKNVGWGKYTTK